MMTAMINCTEMAPLGMIGGIILVVVLILWLKQRQERMLSAERDSVRPDENGAAPDLTSEESVKPELSAEDADKNAKVLEYSFSRLESLSIAGGWEAHVQCRAKENRCRIGIDPAFARYVKVEHVHNGLLIRYTGKKRPETAMSIELSTTAVPGQVKTIGKSRIWIDSVETERFVCKATDGGKVEMPGARIQEFILKLTGSCRAECGGDFESAELEVAGGSNAKLRGSMRKFYARLSGASKAEAVKTEKADIDVSGASKLKLEVTGKLEGDLSGGSTLKYRGEIDTSGIRISGSSRLRNWN